MTLERSEEDFWADFGTFNGFFDPSRWQETRAAKVHVDEFGQAVAEGDFYFTRTLGLGSRERLKISRASMEVILEVFFLENPEGRALGERLIENRQQRMRAALNRVGAQLESGQDVDT